jgi:hypothetical protein
MTEQQLEDIKLFLKELSAISPMRKSLPVDVMEHHMIDITADIDLIKAEDGKTIEEKAELIEKLVFYREMFEKELSQRN